MGFRIESRYLGDIVVLTPEVMEDERGFFMESFTAEKFKALGLPHEFVQDNHSRSKKNVLRGLHFQWDPPLGKLIRVTVGSAFLAVVDIRKGSPTLGQWVGLEVSAENHKQVWVPPGFANGLCVLLDPAEVQYKCTAQYNSKGESGIRFDDPDVGIQWPKVGNYLLSEKDRNAQSLAQWLSSPNSEYLRYSPEP